MSELLNALIEALVRSMLAHLEAAREAGDEFLPTLIAFGQRVTDRRTAMQLQALYRIANLRHHPGHPDGQGLLRVGQDRLRGRTCPRG